MRPLKSLTVETIVELLATTFGEVEDARASEQLTYPLPDTLMRGFALMFFQHPSLLQFQRARTAQVAARVCRVLFMTVKAGLLLLRCVP